MAGSASVEAGGPLWLLAELTYRCPLQCVYCSNPLGYARSGKELSTAEWKDVLSQARALGAAQLGFSGGEPLLRPDLEEIVAEGRRLGFYTNLITSALGLDEARLGTLRDAGLDHVQVSFQDSDPDENDRIAGTRAFARKLKAARLVKSLDMPMVLCFVIHRGNIDRIDRMLELAIELKADQVELAATQYYGWARVNRSLLMPTRAQVERAEAVAHRYQDRCQGAPRILYVVPDYHESRPKPCMNGWGRVFMAVAPDGVSLPCQGARDLPLDFPNVRTSSLAWIWRNSPAFNHYRGQAWMQEPCVACPERERDYGGCRCQAHLLTGDAAQADPVCTLSPHRSIVDAALAEAVAEASAGQAELVYRNPASSRHLSRGP